MKKKLITAFLAVSFCDYGFSMEEGDAVPSTPMKDHVESQMIVAVSSPTRGMETKIRSRKYPINGLHGMEGYSVLAPIAGMFDPLYFVQDDMGNEDYFDRLARLGDSHSPNYPEMALTIATGFGSGGLDFRPMTSYGDIENYEKPFLLNVLRVVRGLQGPDDISTEHLAQKAFEYFLHPFLFTKKISHDDWAHVLLCSAIVSAAAHAFKAGKDTTVEAGWQRFLAYVMSGEVDSRGTRRTIENPYFIVVDQPSAGPALVPFTMLFQKATGMDFFSFLRKYNIEQQFAYYWNIVLKKEGSFGSRKTLLDIIRAELPR